jgi:hypothetical protein
MTLPIFKNGDPLFTIILRDKEAKSKLSKWLGSSRSIQAKIEDNKLQIYDHNTLNLFVITWSHNWENILIWDIWAKRHIYF